MNISPLKLKESLEPFVNLIQPHNKKFPDNRIIYEINGQSITMGNLKKIQEIYYTATLMLSVDPQ